MRREALSWLVAPLLLVTVAVVQFSVVIVHDLSTWSGVGFGMFASIDNEQTRAVSLSVELDGGTFRVPSAVLGGRGFELRVLPAESHLRDAAVDLLARRFEVNGDRALPTSDRDGRRADAATVGIVGVVFEGDPDRPVLRSRTIREVTVHR